MRFPRANELLLGQRDALSLRPGLERIKNDKRKRFIIATASALAVAAATIFGVETDHSSVVDIAGSVIGGGTALGLGKCAVNQFGEYFERVQLLKLRSELRQQQLTEAADPRQQPIIESPALSPEVETA